MKRLVLISCSKMKAQHGCEARDLYTSPMFQMARAYAERSGVPWGILSAQHGLLWPTVVVEPYDLKLGSLRKAQRAEWGERVAEVLSRVQGAGHVVEIHAGARYVEALRGPVEALGWRIEEPLARKQVGERLHWYCEKAREAEKNRPSWFERTEVRGAIVCPHCGYRDENHRAHQVHEAGGRRQTYCWSCKRPFEVEGEIVYTYTTRIRAKAS